MKTQKMVLDDIKLDNSWDVIVVGGGPSGCTAAAAAAREGCKTLLIEATGSLGGMGTSGLIPAWCPFSDQIKIIYRGLAEEIFRRSKLGVPHVDSQATEWVPINAEWLKTVYDDIVIENGAHVLFNTFLCSVKKDTETTVSYIILANKSGLTAYKSKIYIDCTGDADLAAWAGAEFVKGGDNGELQPATHCFILSNVNEHQYLFGESMHTNNPNNPIYRILKEGTYSLIPDDHLCNNLVGSGVVGFNAGHIPRVDNTDPFSVSNALIQGRKMAEAYRQSLADYLPATFSGAHLTATGALMGIRETRRIVGDYILTIEDYLARRSFPDEICRNSYFLDCHKTQDNPQSCDAPSALSGTHYGPGESHGIPYRCLVPKGLHNVLVAGRSISSDRMVNASVRVMPVCLATGEAAGVAGALAAASDTDIHRLDTVLLRAKLREHGAFLPD